MVLFLETIFICNRNNIDVEPFCLWIWLSPQFIDNEFNYKLQIVLISFIADNHLEDLDMPHDQLKLSLALSAIVVFLFLLGVFICVLFTKCAKRKGQQGSNTVANVSHNHALMPIYEEVHMRTTVDANNRDAVNCEVEDNVAYAWTYIK